MKTSFFRIIALSIILFFFNSLSISAQAEEEDGYVKLEGEQIIQCKIWNKDWQNNPSEIEYRKNGASKRSKATIDQIEEFTISEKRKYVKFIGDIDKSSNIIDQMDYNKLPDFKRDTILLRVMVEGKYSLYEYKENGITKYFYSIDNSSPKQLVYKQYLFSDTGVGNLNIKKNETYRSQIIEQINCTKISFLEIKDLEYRRKKLITHFNTQNECAGSESINFVNKTKRKSFNITAKGGVKSVRFYDSVNNGLLRSSTRKTLGYKAGIQLEYIFPFANNKISLSIEPSISHFTGKYDSEINNSSLKRTTKYTSLDIPFYPSYHIYINKKIKISIPLGLNLSIPFNSSEIDHELTINGTGFSSFLAETGPNITFFSGATFHLDDWQLGVTYELKRNAVTRKVKGITMYDGLHIMLGYTFLNK